MKRIENEAEMYYPKPRKFPENRDQEIENEAAICLQVAFKLGAKTCETRSQKLVEALKEIIGEAITKRECENIAKQALSDWEGEKEGE